MPGNPTTNTTNHNVSKDSTTLPQRKNLKQFVTPKDQVKNTAVDPTIVAARGGGGSQQNQSVRRKNNITNSHPTTVRDRAENTGEPGAKLGGRKSHRTKAHSSSIQSGSVAQAQFEENGKKVRAGYEKRLPHATTNVKGSQAKNHYATNSSKVPSGTSDEPHSQSINKNRKRSSSSSYSNVDKHRSDKRQLDILRKLGLDKRVATVLSDNRVDISRANAEQIRNLPSTDVSEAEKQKLLLHVEVVAAEKQLVSAIRKSKVCPSVDTLATKNVTGDLVASRSFVVRDALKRKLMKELVAELSKNQQQLSLSEFTAKFRWTDAGYLKLFGSPPAFISRFCGKFAAVDSLKQVILLAPATASSGPNSNQENNVSQSVHSASTRHQFVKAPPTGNVTKSHAARKDGRGTDEISKRVGHVNGKHQFEDHRNQMVRSNSDYRSASVQNASTSNVRSGNKDYKSTSNKDYKSNSNSNKDCKSTSNNNKDYKATSNNNKDCNATSNGDKDHKSTRVQHEERKRSESDMNKLNMLDTSRNILKSSHEFESNNSSSNRATQSLPKNTDQTMPHELSKPKGTSHLKSFDRTKFKSTDYPESLNRNKLKNAERQHGHSNTDMGITVSDDTLTVYINHIPITHGFQALTKHFSRFSDETGNAVRVKLSSSKQSGTVTFPSIAAKEKCLQCKVHPCRVTTRPGLVLCVQGNRLKSVSDKLVLAAFKPFSAYGITRITKRFRSLVFVYLDNPELARQAIGGIQEIGGGKVLIEVATNQEGHPTFTLKELKLSNHTAKEKNKSSPSAKPQHIHKGALDEELNRVGQETKAAIASSTAVRAEISRLMTVESVADAVTLPTSSGVYETTTSQSNSGKEYGKHIPSQEYPANHQSSEAHSSQVDGQQQQIWMDPFGFSTPNLSQNYGDARYDGASDNYAGAKVESAPFTASTTQLAGGTDRNTERSMLAENNNAGVNEGSSHAESSDANSDLGALNSSGATSFAGNQMRFETGVQASYGNNPFTSGQTSFGSFVSQSPFGNLTGQSSFANGISGQMSFGNVSQSSYVPSNGVGHISQYGSHSFPGYYGSGGTTPAQAQNHNSSALYGQSSFAVDDDQHATASNSEQSDSATRGFESQKDTELPSYGSVAFRKPAEAHISFGNTSSLRGTQNQHSGRDGNSDTTPSHLSESGHYSLQPPHQSSSKSSVPQAETSPTVGSHEQQVSGREHSDETKNTDPIANFSETHSSSKARQAPTSPSASPSLTGNTRFELSSDATFELLSARHRSGSRGGVPGSLASSGSLRGSSTSPLTSSLSGKAKAQGLAASGAGLGKLANSVPSPTLSAVSHLGATRSSPKMAPLSGKTKKSTQSWAAKAKQSAGGPRLVSLKTSNSGASVPPPAPAWTTPEVVATVEESQTHSPSTSAVSSLARLAAAEEVAKSDFPSLESVALANGLV